MYTTGPWKRGGEGLTTRVYSPMCTDIAICPVGEPDRSWAWQPAYGVATLAEAEANARLIAAAPLMLAALQWLVAADNCNYERDAMRYAGYFDLARRAVETAADWPAHPWPPSITPAGQSNKPETI